MKRWALLTALLYMLALVAVLGPVFWIAFWPESLEFVMYNLKNQLNWQSEAAYFYIGLGVWINVMVLAEIALLVVPVRIASRRPVTKRWLIWPILASFFMLVLMVAAMCLAVHEHLSHTSGVDEIHWWIAFGLIGFIWLVWMFLFGFYTGGREPKTFMSRLVKFMLAGSILELLVAVPTHVVARVRNYCCAGFGTFWGLAVGFSVMLFAFGPGVFFLFVRRWGAIRPPKDGKG